MRWFKRKAIAPSDELRLAQAKYDDLVKSILSPDFREVIVNKVKLAQAENYLEAIGQIRYVGETLLLPHEAVEAILTICNRVAPRG